MHNKLDKIRDKEPERKEMHKKHDKIRDKTPKRKKMHSRIDHRRYQKEERRYYINMRNNLKYQKKLFDTFDTDTGFDLICSSCLQYKCMEYCKSISVLSIEAQKKFIISNCALLKNREEGQYVCNLCLKDIKKGRLPKRSHKNKFKFANFPKRLISNRYWLRNSQNMDFDIDFGSKL